MDAKITPFFLWWPRFKLGPYIYYALFIPTGLSSRGSKITLLIDKR